MQHPHNLPPQPITAVVLEEKYLKGGESLQELYTRVAKSLASVETTKKNRDHYEQLFLKNMHAGAIGAGRIMASAGTDIQATLINCFVQPVGDCIQGFDEEGRPGIYEALREAAETMRRGGGVGYDFSAIRPKGSFVKGTQSISSGPCPYIDVFDKSCTTVESAGSRRGAQMGVMRVDHPDIMEFITAKRTPGRWNNFNVSVGMTEHFMSVLAADGEWELVHKSKPGEALLQAGAYQRKDGLWVYRTVKAREMWDTIMKSTYDFAEPGILFLDNINTDNNLRYCETIQATNPCGEQPLPSYGCCDLGPIILTNFVCNPFGFAGNPSFDFDALTRAVAMQVRALDNVLDATFWPLPQQQAESASKRRIGVGFTGLGNTLAMLKVKYNSQEGLTWATAIARQMRDAAYSASVELAKEKGAFPLFDADAYLAEGTFASRLPKVIKARIRNYGIRNSHLLSIAPTGTVSLAFADNASNGIEPPFSWTYTRKKREQDGSHTIHTVEDYSWRLYRHLGGDTNNLPDYFVSALEMSAQDHLAMMAAVQPFIDTAISKTVNIPADYPFEDFKDLYLQAHKAKLKGLATYRPNSILGAVLATTPAPTPEPEPSEKVPVDLQKLVIEKRPNGPLQATSDKIEYWTQDGQKTLYLITSFLTVSDDQGNTAERAIEFFAPVGQSGESQQWMTSTMRMLSLAARGGFLEKALSDMRKVAWDRGAIRFGFVVKDDGTRVPAWHDSEVAVIAYAIQNIIAHRREALDDSTDTAEVSEHPHPVMSGKKCPECGAHAVIKKDGCSYCTSCGYLGSCG